MKKMFAITYQLLPCFRSAPQWLGCNQFNQYYLNCVLRICMYIPKQMKCDGLKVIWFLPKELKIQVITGRYTII